MSTHAWKLLMVGLVLASGCSKKPEPQPPKQVTPEEKLQSTLMQLDRFMLESNLVAAITLMDAARQNPEFTPQRGWLFSIYTDLNIRAGRLAEAEAEYFKAADDVELARAGFDVFRNYYAGVTNKAETLAWTERLLAARLPPELAQQAFVWRINVIHETQPLDAFLATVPECLSRFDAVVSARIIGDMMGGMMAGGKLEEAERTLQAVEQAGRQDVPLQQLLARTRVRLAARQERWPDVEIGLARIPASLSDADAEGVLGEVLSMARQKKAYDVATRIARSVLDGPADRSASMRQAAFQWLEIPRDQKLPSEIPARLDQLMASPLPPSVILGMQDRHFYWIMQEGKREDLTAMVAGLEKLVPRLGDTNEVTSARAMIIDGAFVTEDYDRALQILEEGIPERSKSWHDMAINKVHAHMALKVGKTDEAVERFRAFMKTVEAWEKPEQDPSTGILYTKEMTLGRNAKRIGEIYKAAGQAEKAAAAFQEARGYFEVALKDPQVDTPEKDVIQKDMATLPAP